MKKNPTAEIGNMIAGATTVAACEAIRDAGIDPHSVDMDVLMVACRREAKAALQGILDDGKTLLESGRAPWLKTLLTVECVAAGRRAAQDVL